MHDRILITGGTGLIGQGIVQRLRAAGHALKILTRDAPRQAATRTDPGIEFVAWNPHAGELAPNALEGVTAVVHLAGAPVAQRWTPAAKRAILASRVESTALLHQHMAQLPADLRPRVCVSASAIGIYPSSDAWLNEESAPGDGFAADVVRQWEAGMEAIEALGVRTVRIRIGLVLSANGGMLGRLLPVFKLGMGSPVGDGNQWQSWVHHADVERMIIWALSTETVRGAFNATAPNPVSNAELSKHIARACHRPYWAPRVPVWALKWAFGEMASIVLASQRVSCQRALDQGFTFDYPEVESALNDLLR